MRFIDQVNIYVKAGNGGHGCASFRREKFVPKGGPSGGDGGKGGSVFIEASKDMHTLLDYRYKREYNAQNGMPGQGSKKHGQDGHNIVLKVPVGTIVSDEKTKQIVVDLVEDGQRICVAKGGDGGRGNVHFKSAVNQAPRQYEEGWPGDEIFLCLELKLLADVGLVGCPNAGKSTLISHLSAAKSKIADYPFTTLKPVLGMVDNGYGDAFVMADIPGLIEGAHQGSGLGDTFLKHIERTRVLLFVIDISGLCNDPLEDYEILVKELKQYDKHLLDKKQITALNKADLPYEQEIVDQIKKKSGQKICLISAVSGEGIVELKQELWTMLNDKQEDSL